MVAQRSTILPLANLQSPNPLNSIFFPVEESVPRDILLLPVAPCL